MINFCNKNKGQFYDFYKYFAVIFLLFLALFPIRIVAQSPKYFAFTYHQKLGIADLEGNEIEKPAYKWESYTIDKNSNFILLMNYDEPCLLIDKFSGEKRYFQHLDDNPIIEIDGKEYFYVISSDGNFLIDNKNFVQKISIQGNYYELSYSGDYILAFYNEDYKFGDILRKSDRTLVMKNVNLLNFEFFEFLGNRKNVYTLYDANKLNIYNKSLQQIATYPIKIKDHDHLINFLEKKYLIIPSQIQEVKADGDWKDPHLDGESVSKEVMNFIFKYDDGSKKPILQLNRKNFRVSVSSFDHTISLTSSKNNYVFTEYKFHVDPETFEICFPKKYWNEINLIKNSDKE